MPKMLPQFTKKVFLLTITGVILSSFIYFAWKMLPQDQEKTEPIFFSQATYSSSESIIASVKAPLSPQAHIEISNSQNKKVDGNIETKATGNETKIIIDPPRVFQPGKYTLKITDGKTIYEQNFNWGVLALNSDKATYIPNETAQLQFGILDEKGMMVCDAQVTLTVKTPTGVIDELSTHNGEIKVNPECKIKDLVQKPDYESTYQLGGSGTYSLTLTAVHRNGTYTITDKIAVKDTVPFSVERKAHTRIYPIHQYPVEITITANQDFNGEIVERVPTTFKVSNAENTDVDFNLMRFPGKGTVSYQYQEIVWNTSLKKGETVTLGYIYDAPDISPYFFLTGPLQFKKDQISTPTFEENRAWQIAVDDLTTALEQQINIIDQDYSITSQTPAPTDNSLGLIKFDGSKYNGETAYFEAVINNPSDVASEITTQYSDIYCVSATDCKAVYQDETNSALNFIDCDNAACTTKTVTILDGDTGCVLDGCVTFRTAGTYPSIDCTNGTSDCKISYYTTSLSGATTALIFADCDDATCSTGTIQVLDGGTGCVLTSGDVCDTSITAGEHSSIKCPTTDDCKISYYDSTNSALMFADCADATCSSGSVQILDGTTDGSNCALTGGDVCDTSVSVGQYTSLYCPTADDCKISYYDSGNSALMFADCGDATCSTGSVEILDGLASCGLSGGDICNTAGSTGQYTSLYCSSATDCKISYYETTSTALSFADCDDATCSAGTTYYLDGATGCNLTSGDGCSTTSESGRHTSLYCPATDDCKISYYDFTNTALRFADCDDATCSAGTSEVIDGFTGCGLTGGDSCSDSVEAGTDTALDCSSGATNCKITYLESVSAEEGLLIVDCTNATCSAGSVNQLAGGMKSQVGGAIDMDCPSADNCKISYYEALDESLRFADCNDESCSTKTISILDGAPGCVLTGGDVCDPAGGSVGQSSAIDCPTSSDCKIAYYDFSDGDLWFADCQDEACSTGSTELLDGQAGCSLTSCIGNNVGDNASLDCSNGATDCKIAYNDTSNTALIFADCDDATCSSGNVEILDGHTGCVLTSGDVCDTSTNLGFYTSLDCPTTNDCKIAYYDNGNSALMFGDCDDATCSTGSVQILDGTTDGSNCALTGGDVCDTSISAGLDTSLDCPTATDCKIAYYDNGNSALMFGDCDDATCSTGSVQILDGASDGTNCALTGGDVCSTGFSIGRDTSIDCSPGATDCKIVYTDPTNNTAIFFGDCDDATCSTGSQSMLDGTTGCRLTAGEGCTTSGVINGATSLDCTPGGSNCKIAYSDDTDTSLDFGDCSDASCLSGSVYKVDDGELVSVKLYDSSGNLVPGGVVTVNTTQNTRVRSSALSLSDNTNYTIRVHNNSPRSNSASILAARLIIPQAGTFVSDTQTQIEIGNNDTTTATSYELLTDQKIWHYDSTKFSDVSNIYFEASLANSGANTTSAALSTSATCASTVTGTEISVTGTTWTLSRTASSIASNLVTGTDYWVCIKTTAGTASIANAKIIIDQANTNGIEDMQLTHQYINTLATDTDSTYTGSEFLNQLTQSNFTGADTISYFYEATMKTSAGTGYTQLYNQSDTSAITGSEISTTSTSYDRVRTASDISANLPADAKILDSQVKNSATNTTSVANSWIIIEIAGSPPPPEMHMNGVNLNGINLN